MKRILKKKRSRPTLQNYWQVERQKEKMWWLHCSLIPLELSLKIKHLNGLPSFSRAISPQSTRILLYPSSSTTTNRKKIPWKVVKDWHTLLYAMIGLKTVELPSANWIFSYSMFYRAGMLPQPQVPGQARTITLFVLAQKALSPWIYSTRWWYSPSTEQEEYQLPFSAEISIQLNLIS